MSVPVKEAASSTSDAPVRSLSLLDSICIIVGTIIGSGIFGTTPLIAANTTGPSQLLWVWVLGGAVAMTGALCFAELMTRFPGAIGGDYVYLKRAFGLPAGFTFAWVAFWIIRPGNIGAMAMIFSQYFVEIVGGGSTGQVAFALLAVVGLSFTNLIGLRSGKVVQNVLTIAKVAGIGLIVLLAVVKTPPAEVQATQSGSDAVQVQTDDAEVDSNSDGGSSNDEEKESSPKFWFAMVLIMFTYGGWNDIAFVAGEVKRPERNLVRSIIFGTAAVMVIYLAINWAFLHMLGYDGVTGSTAVATDFTKTAFGPETTWGTRSSQLVAALICISCLGAINGMILTSPRIYFSLGRDIKPLAFLARLNMRRDAPWQAIILQAVITIGLILLCLRYTNAFGVILAVTAPYFWGFLGATVLSLLVFRYSRTRKDDSSTSTAPIFKVPLFPLPALFFAAVCGAMAWSSIQHVIEERYTTVAVIVLSTMVVGVFAAFILSSRKYRSVE
ncbi:MAG: amino acid permease [Planctomycetota bacterium]